MEEKTQPENLGSSLQLGNAQSPGSGAPLQDSMMVNPQPQTLPQSSPQAMAQVNQGIKPKKSFSFIKLARVLIWGLVAVFLPVGLAVTKSAELSSAYMDGSYTAREKWGNIIFWVAFSVGILNLIWGTARWVLRWKKEKWTAGKVAGKLIGGGIWRTLAVLPVVVLSLMFIAPAVGRIISDGVNYDTEISVLSSSMIAADFENGVISADDYINYLYDVMYDVDALPDKYKSEELDFEIDILSEVDKYLDELDVKTLQKVFDAVTLANIDFDIDASSNSSTPVASLFSQPVYAQTKKATVLNKAQKSPSGKFVIFYTDAGDDAVTDEKISELGQEIDKIVNRYWDRLQLQYSYDMNKVGFSKEGKIKKVLKNNNLDENLLDSAMPVYVAKTVSEGSTIIAYYVGADALDILKRILVRIDAVADIKDGVRSGFILSVPSFPMISVNPDNLDNAGLEQVVSHELGHHYSDLFCQEKYGKSYNGSNEFTSETVANYLSLKISDNTASEKSFLRNWHNNGYLRQGISESLDKIRGYGSYAFLLNYTDIVHNGHDIVMRSLCGDNALEFLHDQAGEKKFSEAMTKLAEKNLTSDYGDLKAVRAYDGVLPVSEEAPCGDFCTKSYTIPYASMRYVYFTAEEYKNRKIIVENDGPILFMGKNRSNEWEVISSNEGASEYFIEKEFPYFPYRVVAVAMVNANIKDEHTASIQVIEGELGDEIDGPGGLDDLNFALQTDILTPIGSGCYAVNTDSLFELPKSMFNVAGSAIDFISEFDSENDYTEIKKEFDSSVAEYDRGAADAKKELSGYYVTLCINDINSKDFDATKKKIQSAMGFNFNVMDQKMDSLNRTSLFVSGDIFTQTAKLYSLAQVDGEMVLVTVNIRKND